MQLSLNVDVIYTEILSLVMRINVMTLQNKQRFA